MHWRIILRNICSNWAGYAVTALIGFFLSPFIVHSLGTTGYGLWTLVLSLTGYFGLLDFGIRSSVGRFVARYLALNDDESGNRILSTAFAILLGGGLLALSATIVVVTFFFGSFHVDMHFELAAKVALLITGLTMSCALPLGTFSSLLVAMERFDILSGVTIIAELTRAGLIVVFLRGGHGLVSVALIALFTSIAQYVTMALFAKALHHPLKLRVSFVDRRAFKELFGFGVFRFIWIVANQLIFYSDAVVIGIFLGAGAITYYAIAGTLINYGRTFVSLVTDTFYPAATRMDAKQDLDGLRRLLIFGTRITLLISLPLCIGFFFLGEQFITLWMGKAYASSALFLMVLTIPQFIGLPQYVSALVLAGMARHRVLAYVILAEGFVNLVLSIVLVRKIGLVGVAWGTVIPDLICTAVIIPFYTLRVLKLGVREYVTGAFVRPVVAAVPIIGLGYGLSHLVATPSWALFGGEVAAMCGVFAILSYFICLDSRQRAVAVGKLGNMFHPRAVVHEV